MALHIIIDGYNLIRQSPELRQCEARELAGGRQALLARLAAYRRHRPGHRVTVVFDGREGGDWRETRDRQQGLGVVYSRRGEAADDVIKRLLARDRAQAIVVTSDRELQHWAEQVGATWIGAPDFEKRHLEPQGQAVPEEAEAGSLRPPGKKGPARRLPKRQRQRQQRLRKL